MTNTKNPLVGMTTAQGKTYILRAALAFKSREGRWPGLEDGHDPLIGGLSWRSAGAWLSRKADTTLAALCGTRIGKTYQWPADLQSSENLAREHGEIFLEKMSRLPTVKDGAIESLQGLATWRALNHWLRRKGSGLATAFGRRPWPNSVEELIELARTHSLLYQAKNGELPSTRSGPITTFSPRATWLLLNMALHKHGSSLCAAIGRPGLRTHDEWIALLEKDWATTGVHPKCGTPLYSAWRKLKRECPQRLLDAGLPLSADRKARRPHHSMTTEAWAEVRARSGVSRRVYHYETLREVVVCLLPVAHELSQSHKNLPVFGTAPRLKSFLCSPRFRPHDLCQVTTPTRLRHEVEEDCWRFTLKGAKRPDPRKWADILASGDNKKIESAERVAFLDWENPDKGAPCVGSGRGRAPATRRPWSPPATQPEAGKPATLAKGKGKHASAKA